MAVSYKRLWKLLVDKEMSKSNLRKKAEIAPKTMMQVAWMNRKQIKELLKKQNSVWLFGR